ncbi:MAG: hypothetical protein CME65_10540 [Halobacteriovoraceae bacterium]|nr:hypothetical protein [Halobacteriovoraceae bacterium]|tara:strand:+ start:3519 stop:4415 length:897 start_codon:yes stop_codon:yes gene_type:complete
MKKIELIRTFDDIKISNKVILGNILVFCLFGLVSMSYLDNLREENSNLQKLSILTRTSSTILDINKEISEIQRLVKVYGSTGASSVLEKIKDSHELILKQVSKVDRTYLSKSEKELVINLSDTLVSYGKHISELEFLYNQKNDFINTKLPSKFRAGESILKEELKLTLGNKNKVKVLEIQNSWYQVYLSSRNFLQKKDYQHKKDLKKTLQKIESLINESGMRNSVKKDFNIIRSDYKKVFEQAIQSNRIYLSLVNVVMAGTSIEVAKTSSILRDESLKDLERILELSNNKFSENKDEM